MLVNAVDYKMMEVSEIIRTIAESMEKSEQYLDYTLPFVIISDDLNVIFRSKKFYIAQDSTNDLLGDIMLAIRDSLTNDLDQSYDSKHGIVCCKVASIAPRKYIFYAYLCDQNETHNDDLEKHHHDIHGPIRNISNLLQLIQKQVEGRDIKGAEEYVTLALNSVDTLSELNENMLSNSKSSLVDLRVVIDRIERLLKTQINEAGCTIHIDRAIPQVRGNYMYILRIFKNLIENSLLHAKAEHVTITVQLLSQTDTAILVLFEDNGACVSHEVKDAIDSALKHCDSVYGYLGLKICRELMDCMNGDIEIIKEKAACSYRLTFDLIGRKEVHATVS
ncbi:MAG: HAMP domain-containing histidine kinase [Holosporales bacterium]|jgi:nitrogen-specific signal transduction histidine kinase|nr:HAMP domain-containing histidine kinase [Holosporales bacterium]